MSDGAAAASGVGDKAAHEQTQLIEADGDDAQKAWSRKWGKIVFLVVSTICIAGVVVTVIVRQKEINGE